MPKLSQTEDWVEAIRVFIRDTLGNKNWQIAKNKGKTMLGIRFEDGSRSYKYISYKWQRAKLVGLRSIKFKSFIDHPFELKKISNFTF
tara:strand:- start:54 stop:317 length:264 start_codon:yes stop_codon:yes gene_type:complete